MEQPRMSIPLDPHTIDLAVVVIANLINLALIALFLSRPLKLPRLEYFLGLFLSALILPLIALAILNLKAGREWWSYVLPLVMAAFLLLEFILEYVLGINWRKTWFMGPYLLLYYFSLMMMIGYAFLVGKPYGFITLVTYFLGLAATWYSYTHVGY
jgi:hypothetical protein